MHQPVLVEQAIEVLQLRPGDVVVDGTVGAGGHSLAILERIGQTGLLIGLDRDQTALNIASERLGSKGLNFVLIHCNSSDLKKVLENREITNVNAILFDYGVSSMQLDDRSRGFSFMGEAKLDMRMDNCQHLTAWEIVNSYEEEELANIIYRFGEEYFSRRIAKAIVNSRPVDTTVQLAKIVEDAVGGRKGKKIHPATKTFQALRIFVNNELFEIETSLKAAIDVISPGGRIAAIGFHSLEDKLIKQIFGEATGVDAERDPYGNLIPTPQFERITKSAIKSSKDDPNPRARSARLRAIRRKGGNDES